jgi:hypothetical protein
MKMFFNKIKITDSDGSSPEKAIVNPNIKSHSEGVDAEYKYLESIYGKQNVEWRLNEQLMTMYRKRFYDIIKIKFRNGQKRTFWFDINAFYEGKDE